MKRLFFLLAATFAFNVCYSQYITMHAHHVQMVKFQENGNLVFGGPYPCSFDIVLDIGDEMVYIFNRELPNNDKVYKIFNAKAGEKTSDGTKFSFSIIGPLNSSKNKHKIIATFPNGNISKETSIHICFQHENGDAEFFDTKILQVSESSFF